MFILAYPVEGEDSSYPLLCYEILCQELPQPTSHTPPCPSRLSCQLAYHHDMGLTERPRGSSRGWEMEEGKPQTTSPQEVAAEEIQVQVCLYAFDLLYLNGQVSPCCSEHAALPLPP